MISWIIKTAATRRYGDMVLSLDFGVRIAIVVPNYVLLNIKEKKKWNGVNSLPSRCQPHHRHHYRNRIDRKRAQPPWTGIAERDCGQDYTARYRDQNDHPDCGDQHQHIDGAEHAGFPGGPVHGFIILHRLGKR